jgi:hypothetical protein
MPDLRRRIERIIETDPVIKKGLQRGIINSRALARYFREIERIDSTEDAILGVVRRYPLSDGDSSDSRCAFRECELSLRNKLAELEVEYHQETMYQISEFASNLKTARGENLKLIVGVGFIRVIADQNSLEGLRRTLRPREEISYSTDLTEISVHLPRAAGTTKGIVARIAMELALNDINLFGIIDGTSVLALLVAGKNAPQALEALQRMMKEEDASHAETSDQADRLPPTTDPPGKREDEHNRTLKVMHSPRDTLSRENLQTLS